MVGASYWTRNIESAALDARIVVIAYMSGSKIVDFDISKVLKKRISILTTQLRSRGKEYQSCVRDIFRDEVMPALVSGEIKPVIDGVYSWKDIVDVHKRMDASTNAGKIVCVVD
jgi:NADPH:quinone reductase-like Zn-dependent oxidoreductase